MIGYSAPGAESFERKADVRWDIAIHSQQLAHDEMVRWVALLAQEDMTMVAVTHEWPSRSGWCTIAQSIAQ
ncbi:MAG TPA: hypothetical protein VGG82_05740 [Casimicrobiaceae bacterium]